MAVLLEASYVLAEMVYIAFGLPGTFQLHAYGEAVSVHVKAPFT